ncbi:MAG: SAM-dependent chlorinase/fluorinase, partial [Actinomycetota bacterium]|nr:SAM-dependent chlorinase/fluorinase [Actinomycetota bacterium]
AAALAAGAEFDELGKSLDTESLTRLELPKATPEQDRLILHVLTRDRFGNLILNADREPAEPSFLTAGSTVLVEFGDTVGIEIPVVETFGQAEPEQPLLYFDSSGRLTLAVNCGNAAGQFGLVPDDQLTITASRKPGGSDLPSG